MNNYSTMASKIGVRVGDTSTTFSTTIKQYINDRYRDIMERFNWDTINPSYTFPTVIGQQDYNAPTDLNKELYLYDGTNFLDVSRQSLQDLENNYQVSLNDSGNAIRYAIYDYMDTSSPPIIKRKIRLYPIPTSVITIAMPYLVKATDLSATTDLPIIECDLACELGATADAWRTKRQFAKANDFETQYERRINTMIWNRANQPNSIVQFSPKTYNRDNLY
jgi:hypothetical protein